MRFKFLSTWQVLKSWYTGGDPEQRFGRRFADGLNQNSLVPSVAQARDCLQVVWYKNNVMQ